MTMAQVWVYVNGHITHVVNSNDSLDGHRKPVEVVCRPSIKFPNGESLNKVRDHDYTRITLLCCTSFDVYS